MLVSAQRGVGVGLLACCWAAGVKSEVNTESCLHAAKQLLGLCYRKQRWQTPRLSSGEAAGGQLGFVSILATEIFSSGSVKSGFFLKCSGVGDGKEDRGLSR